MVQHEYTQSIVMDGTARTHTQHCEGWYSTNTHRALRWMTQHENTKNKEKEGSIAVMDIAELIQQAEDL